MQHLVPLEIFEAAFGRPQPEPLRDERIRVPFPDTAARQVPALDFPLVDVDEEDASEGLIEELHGIASDDELGPTVEEGGTDVLALYLPYAFNGPDVWGIWWNEPAMLRATARLALEAMRRNAEVRLPMVGHCLRRTVRQHELFHFTVEYTAAHLSLQNQRDCYRPNFRDSSRHECEEKLATAWEMIWLSQRYASKALPTGCLNAIRTAWRKTPRPFPYSAWEDAAGEHWTAAAEKHAKALCGIQSAGRLYRELIRLTPRNPAPLVVPEYSIGVPRIFDLGYANTLGRLAPPTVTQVLRHANHAEHSGTPPGVRCEQRSKHNAAVVRAGKPRPVTLDKTKWDRVDCRVVGQLAGLFDMSRQAYLHELQAF